MMIVVAPTVTEEGLPAVVERISNLIEAQDGAVESFTHDSPWGHRRLAYPIQNFRDAFYVLYYFNAPPRAIIELDRELRLDNVIIRHLIVKFDPLAHREYHADTDGEDGDEEDQPVAEAAASEPDEDETTEAAEETEGADGDEADEEDSEGTEEDDDVGEEEDGSDEDESDDGAEEADETKEADDGEENEEE